MRWLLETDIFEENLERLHEAIIANGDTYEITKYIPFDNNEHILDIYDQFDVEVFFYGSLNLHKCVRSMTFWNSFCELPKYECTYYYPRLKDYLINSDCLMLPFGMLSRSVFEHFEGNTVFARPSSGSKSFDGQLLGKYSFDEQIWKISQDINPEDVVVLSSSKNIGKEWRLVVTDQVITGSQYKDKGSFETGKCPQEVIDYANVVLGDTNFRPDKMWTLDVCEFDGQLYVLECGGLSCAGLYECDLDKVVKEVKNQLEK